jgi:hypothetical protein
MAGQLDRPEDRDPGGGQRYSSLGHVQCQPGRLGRGPTDYDALAGLSRRRGRSGSGSGSAVTKGVDELRLAHRRPAFNAYLTGPFHQICLGPVLISRAPATLRPDLSAGTPRRRIGNPSRLFLAFAAFPKLLVCLLVLDLRSGHRHLLSLSAGPPHLRRPLRPDQRDIATRQHQVHSWRAGRRCCPESHRTPLRQPAPGRQACTVP